MRTMPDSPHVVSPVSPDPDLHRPRGLPVREAPGGSLRPSGRTGNGFSLIEMMVVVSILLMAFGLMVPSLTEFFRNRVLDTAVGEVTGTLYTARMQAVVSGRPHVVVFFREGLRIYDTRTRTWMAESTFDPDAGQTADPFIYYDLYFAGKHSEQVPSYDEWVAENVPVAIEGEDPPTFKIDGLVGIEFQRDGTLHMRSSGGTDVPSVLFRKDPPEGGDIVIRQRDNDYAAFIDLQPTGTVKSKIDITKLVPSLKAPPDEFDGAEDEDSE